MSRTRTTSRVPRGGDEKMGMSFYDQPGRPALLFDKTTNTVLNVQRENAPKLTLSTKSKAPGLKLPVRWRTAVELYADEVASWKTDVMVMKGKAGKTKGSLFQAVLNDCKKDWTDGKVPEDKMVKFQKKSDADKARYEKAVAAWNKKNPDDQLIINKVGHAQRARKPDEAALEALKVKKGRIEKRKARKASLLAKTPASFKDIGKKAKAALAKKGARSKKKVAAAESESDDDSSDDEEEDSGMEVASDQENDGEGMNDPESEEDADGHDDDDVDDDGDISAGEDAGAEDSLDESVLAVAKGKKLELSTLDSPPAKASMRSGKKEAGKTVAKSTGGKKMAAKADPVDVDVAVNRGSRSKAHAAVAAPDAAKASDKKASKRARTQGNDAPATEDGCNVAKGNDAAPVPKKGRKARAPAKLAKETPALAEGKDDAEKACGSPVKRSQKRPRAADCANAVDEEGDKGGRTDSKVAAIGSRRRASRKQAGEAIWATKVAQDTSSGAAGEYDGEYAFGTSQEEAPAAKVVVDNSKGRKRAAKRQ